MQIYIIQNAFFLPFIVFHSRFINNHNISYSKKTKKKGIWRKKISTSCLFTCRY